MATNIYDCEAYLRALEEQVEAMQKGGEELLGVMEVVKRQVDSMITSLGNMKLMVDMTRRAATLAHGGRVVERVEIKKEQEDSNLLSRQLNLRQQQEMMYSPASPSPPASPSTASTATAEEAEDWGSVSTTNYCQHEEDWDKEVGDTSYYIPSYRTVRFTHNMHCLACGRHVCECQCPSFF